MQSHGESGKDIKDSPFLVTVLMATYNRAKTVRRALDSIQAQDYPNIETIVIDGASTDGTLEILREYERAGKITKLVSEPDHGIYEALNKGIRLASGKILGVLGSDDSYLDGAVSAIVRGFEESGADVVYGGVVYQYSETDRRYDDKSNLDLKLYFYKNPMNHQSLFVRTALQKAHLFDTSYRIAGDYKFFSMLYYSGHPFHHIDVPIATYNMNGLSGTDHYVFRKELKRIAGELLQKFSFTDEEKQAIAVLDDRNRMKCLQAYLVNRIQREGENQDKLISAPARRFIIFGIGTIGREFAKLVELLFGKESIEAFWDNGKGLQGTRHLGIPVESPEPGVTGKLILISSSYYEKEMAEQLDHCGYQRGRDYLMWTDSVRKMAELYYQRCWCEKNIPASARLRG